MSRLESLPQELVESITDHLLLDDLRQLRLTCRTLAVATRPQLAQPVFRGLPWRDDIRRLQELSRLPPCAARIRRVALNFSRMDEYRAVHDSFSFFYMMEPEIRSEILLDEWSGYFAAKRCADRLRDLVGAATAAAALGALPALTSLRLTWRECPWPGPEMERVFQADESAGLVSGREAEVQRVVLRWLWTSEAPLRELEMDALHGIERPEEKEEGKDGLSLLGKDAVAAPGRAVRQLRVLRIRSGSKVDEAGRQCMREALGVMVEKMKELEVYEFDGEDVLDTVVRT